MEEEAVRWAEMPLKDFSDNALGDEISRRRERLDHWNGVYYRDCIPLAHGMRLFGQFYNDSLRPADPYEFIELLRPNRLTGMDRNRTLEELAGMIRQDASLKEKIWTEGRPPSFSFFSERLAAFREQLPFPALMAGQGGPGVIPSPTRWSVSSSLWRRGKRRKRCDKGKGPGGAGK